MLHRAWPKLTYHFGLYPDDVPRFSVREWNRYLEAVREIDRMSQQQQRRR
jgi:hypothetical protein